MVRRVIVFRSPLGGFWSPPPHWQNPSSGTSLYSRALISPHSQDWESRMPTRRQLLKTGAIAGAAALVPAGILLRNGTALAQPVPGGTLDPTTIPKYVTPLFVIPAMPSSGSTSSVDGYSIAAGRFRQQILPAGFGSTTVLGFGSAT